MLSNEQLVVKKGDNLRGKTLTITLYGTSQDGNKLFAFKDNKIDVIRALEQDLDLDYDRLGFVGCGIFAQCYDDNDNQKTYVIEIPNDKDYIVDFIAYDFGVLKAFCC